MEKNFVIKGKQLACTLEGDPKSPPIILIHGCPSYRGIWRQTMSTVNGKYFCIAIDLLGFGASDKPEGGDYSLTAQAQRILFLADQLGLQKFSLVGHSMGGQIAMYIAAVLAPQRVQKLVVVNGIVTGKFTDRIEKKYIPALSLARKWPWLFSLANFFLKFKPIINYAYRHWFFDLTSYPFDSWEADRYAAVNPACSVSLDESFKAIHALDLTQHLRKIKAQTLIIAGRKDEIVPQDQALLAQTLIPNNDLAWIEKCGHFPMYERNGNFNKALGLVF